MHHSAWYSIVAAGYEWPEGVPFRIDIMFQMAFIYLFGMFCIATVVVAALFVLKSGRPILWGMIVGALITAAAFQVLIIVEGLSR